MLNTKFAPAERKTDEEIQVEYQLINSQKLFNEIYGLMTGISALLDENRQIVYSNDEFLKLLGVNSIEPVLGKRPGEIVSCIHSNEQPYGCGTAEACSYCGAVSAILESQKTGKMVHRETRISSVINEKLMSWDFNVSCVPIKIANKIFYILTLQDISDEKRRTALERIFFHDLLNSVGGLNGLLKILKDGSAPEEQNDIINISEETSANILEEIILHRQIYDAEKGDLLLKIESVCSNEILTSSADRIKAHEVGKNRNILIDESTVRVDFETDRVLFIRVLINLLKNALEATPINGNVYIGAKLIDNNIQFWVKNIGVIPDHIQSQLFQRSFSTKGNNRGIGTYSIKLLVENYLGGKVSFISNQIDQTVFMISLPKIFKSV